MPDRLRILRTIWHRIPTTAKVSFTARGALRWRPPPRAVQAPWAAARHSASACTLRHSSASHVMPEFLPRSP